MAWEHVGIFARAVDENGIPDISDPWPAKDVSRRNTNAAHCPSDHW